VKCFKDIKKIGYKSCFIFHQTSQLTFETQTKANSKSKCIHTTGECQAGDAIQDKVAARKRTGDAEIVESTHGAAASFILPKLSTTDKLQTYKTTTNRNIFLTTLKME
jgi:hypothetical protein